MLVMIDLNGFKGVNDAHGHAAGDFVLRAVAAATCSETDGTDAVVARLGGDEFVVLLADGDDPALGRITQRLQRLPVRLPEGTELVVSASVGTSRLSGQGSMDTALSLSDAAMYVTKRRTAAVASPPAG